MTIALGVLARAGMLLGSDSQFTGDSKMDGDKVLLWAEGYAAAVFVVTGNEANAKMAFQDCRRAMRRIPVRRRTLDRLALVIRQTLRPLQEQYVDRRPVESRHEASFDFVIALATRKEPHGRLFFTENSAVVETNTYVSIGSGGYLGEYFFKMSYRPDISFDQAQILMLRALAATKGHDAYCGGESQVLTVKDGLVTATGPHDKSTETEILRYERLTAMLLLQAGDPALSDETYQGSIDSFATEAKRIRARMVSAVNAHRELMRSMSPTTRRTLLQFRTEADVRQPANARRSIVKSKTRKRRAKPPVHRGSTRGQ